MKDLKELRIEIDSIDSKILDLLDKRLEVAHSVAEYKKEHNLPIFDENREKEVLLAISSKTNNPYLKDVAPQIQQMIITMCKNAEHLLNAPSIPFNNIGIIGMGVIGGSIAKAIKAKDSSIIIHSLQRNSNSIKQAKHEGYIDSLHESVPELVKHAEIIIIASPIHTVISIAREIANAATGIKKSVIVIDTASVKQEIASKFEELSTDNVIFYPTHPMAGSENQGFKASKGTFFIGNPWILTPHKLNTTDQTKKIEQLIMAFGSNPVVTTASEHDANVAVVSHMVLLLSAYIYMFVETFHKDSMELAGTGFETTTRRASGNPEMQTSIVIENFTNLNKVFEEFIEYLQKNKPDTDTIHSFFSSSKQKRDAYLDSKVQ